MPQKSSDELRKIGKELKRKHPEFKDFTDLEVGRIGIERGLWEEPQTKLDIPGVFAQSPADSVPKGVADKVAEEVNRIDHRISGFKAWWLTPGACYRADYFVAAANALQKYAGLVEAQKFAIAAQHGLQRVHKDLEIESFQKDAKDKRETLRLLQEVAAAQFELEHMGQELQLGHELKLAELLMKTQGFQVEHAVLHGAWENKVPRDVYVEEQKTRRLNKVSLEHQREEAKDKIDALILAKTADIKALALIRIELTNARKTLREIERSSLPEPDRSDEIANWTLFIKRLEHELVGRQDS